MGVPMRRPFEDIDALERDFNQQQVSISRSYLSIGAEMDLPASAISLEVARNRGKASGHEAIGAGGEARGHRRRGLVKLCEGSVLGGHVITHIRKGWSPQQISGTLAVMSEHVGSVSHETSYQMIYVLPRGEIRRELIVFLRQGRSCAGPAGKARTSAAALLA